MCDPTVNMDCEHDLIPPSNLACDAIKHCGPCTVSYFQSLMYLHSQMIAFRATSNVVGAPRKRSVWMVELLDPLRAATTALIGITLTVPRTLAQSTLHVHLALLTPCVDGAQQLPAVLREAIRGLG